MGILTEIFPRTVLVLSQYDYIGKQVILFRVATCFMFRVCMGVKVGC
jgi:hypothetical protein